MEGYSEHSSLNQDEKNIAMILHGASFAGYMIPMGNILGPLIVWLMKRDEMPFVNACGKNCLNFKISLLIYALISGVLAFIGIGFLLLAAIGLLDIVVTIIAIVKASEGKVYQYPLTIKFLK